jgi:hypothetical protein
MHDCGTARALLNALIFYTCYSMCSLTTILSQQPQPPTRKTVRLLNTDSSIHSFKSAIYIANAYKLLVSLDYYSYNSLASFRSPQRLFPLIKTDRPKDPKFFLKKLDKNDPRRIIYQWMFACFCRHIFIIFIVISLISGILRLNIRLPTISGNLDKWYPEQGCFGRSK